MYVSYVTNFDPDNRQCFLASAVILFHLTWLHGRGKSLTNGNRNKFNVWYRTQSKYN